MHYRMFNSISRPGHPGVKLSAGISEYSRGGGAGGAQPPFLEKHCSKEGGDLCCFDFFICKMGSIFMTLESVI